MDSRNFEQHNHINLCQTSKTKQVNERPTTLIRHQKHLKLKYYTLFLAVATALYTRLYTYYKSTDNRAAQPTHQRTHIKSNRWSSAPCVSSSFQSLCVPDTHKLTHSHIQPHKSHTQTHYVPPGALTNLLT